MTGAATNAIPTEALAIKLESILARLLEAHERLLAIAIDHRNALATADLEQLSRCIKDENDAVQRISELEQERIRVCNQLAGTLGESRQQFRRGPGGRPQTVTSLSSKLPVHVGDRIRAAAERLRSSIEAVRREHAVLKQTAESLAGHMEGLMQQVARRLNQAGTYGRAGSVDGTRAAPTALDLTT